jgi:hypothetical protein
MFEWRLKVNNILGNAYIPYKTIEDAKQALHQLRLNGADGFIYRGERKWQ